MNKSKTSIDNKLRHISSTYFSDTLTPPTCDDYHSRHAKLSRAVAIKFYTVVPIILGTQYGDTKSQFYCLQF